MAEVSVSKTALVKEIRAIMDSTPNGLDSKQIEQDYRSLCGQSLRENCRKLGYRDIDSFLVVLSDEGSVTLEHAARGGYIFRAGLADSSTSHIQDLVKKQVSNKSRKGGRRDGGFRGGSRDFSRGGSSGGSSGGYGRTPQKITPRKELPNKIQANIISLLRSRNHETVLANVSRLYHAKYGAILNFRSSGFHSLREAISSIGELNVTCKNDTVVVSCIPVAPLIKSPCFADGKRRLCMDIIKVLGKDSVPLTKFGERYNKMLGRQLSPVKYGYNSLLNLFNDLVETVDLHRLGDMGDWLISCKSSSSSQGSVAHGGAGDATLSKLNQKEAEKKKRLPFELIKMIRGVIEANPYGVYLANFDQTFELETGLNLTAHTYGYDCIASLLKDSLNDTIEIVSAKFGPMIRVKPTQDTEIVNVDHPTTTATSSESLELQDAVGPGVFYNRPITPPLNRYIEIIVSQVYSPGDLYVQVMANDNTGKRLEEVMDMLEEFYKPAEANKSYLLPAMFATPGQLVVCKFPNDQFWHRGKITRVVDANFVQVLFVDYGTTCAVHKSQLYYLRQKFLTLPTQAQPATLFGIVPSTGSDWSSNACRAFLNLTADKRLCAIVLDVDQSQRLSLCLTDTTGAIDLHINDYMVSSNFATFCGTTKPLPNQNFNQLKVDNFDWQLSSDDDDEEEEEEEEEGKYSPHKPPSLPTHGSCSPPASDLTKHRVQINSNIAARQPLIVTSKEELPAELHQPSISTASTAASLPLPTAHKPADADAAAETKRLRATKSNLQLQGVKTRLPSILEDAEAASVPPLESEMPPLEPVIPSLESEMPPLEPVIPTLEPEMPPPESVIPPLEPEMPPPESAIPPLEPVMPPLEPEMPPLEPDLLPVDINSNSEVPPLEPDYVSFGTSLQAHSSTNQMPPLEVIKKTIMQTAKVRPQLYPVTRTQHPSSQTIPHSSGSQHYPPQFGHYRQMQAAAGVMYPSYPDVYGVPSQHQVYQGQPFMYSTQQYPVYQLPAQYPSSYIVPSPIYYRHGTQNQPHNLNSNYTHNYPSNQAYNHPSNHEHNQTSSRNHNTNQVHTSSHASYPPAPNTHGHGDLTEDNLQPSSVPPPLEVIESEGDIRQQLLDEGPPPLFRVSDGTREVDSVQANATRRNSSNSDTAAPALPSMQSLQYRLSGLQLKQKRLQREKSYEQSADYSGAESSDSELSSLEKEIEDCSQHLSQMKGAAGAPQLSSKPPALGRGRGRLYLMALASSE